MSSAPGDGTVLDVPLNRGEEKLVKNILGGVAVLVLLTVSTMGLAALLGVHVGVHVKSSTADAAVTALQSAIEPICLAVLR